MIHALMAAALSSAQPTSDLNQAVLRALSRTAPVVNGIVSVTLLSNMSIDALWHGNAAVNTLQIEASNAGTSFYLSGLATGPLLLRPQVRLRQLGHEYIGRVVNVAYLNGRTAPEGAAVLGLLEFAEKVDPTVPFVIILDNTAIDFTFDPKQPREWTKISVPKGQGF